ncbi:MAG: MoaD/ThiS family protein [Bacillota bacterium]
MFKVTVRYFNLIGDSLGKKSEVISLEEHSTFQDLVKALLEMYGDKLRELLLDEDGSLLPHIRVFINDGIMNPQLGEALKEGDEVSFFVAVVGG